jgi:hypothetical protein
VQEKDPLYAPHFPLIEVFRPTPRPDLSGFRALVRRLRCELRYARATLSRLAFRVLNKTHIVWRALRSCFVHIRTQPSTDILLGIGPALIHRPGRGWAENPRSECCKNHIEKLKALHPGLDRVDLRLFLAGFEAGEEFAFRNGIGSNTSTSEFSSD